MGKNKSKKISCNKKDCFAYNKGNCSILLDTHFKNKECPFYKPKKKKAK